MLKHTHIHALHYIYVKLFRLALKWFCFYGAKLNEMMVETDGYLIAK